MLNKRMFLQALPTIGLCFLLCGIGECVIEQPGPEDAGPGNNTYTCYPETGVYFDDNDTWGTDYIGEKLGGYIYAPKCAERPEEAPVVFFFHLGAGDRQDHYQGFFEHLAGKNYIVIAPNYHRPPVDGDVAQIFSQAPIEWRNAGIAGAKAGYQYYVDVVRGDPNDPDYPKNDVPAPLLEQGELVYGVAGHSIGAVIGTALANPTIRNNVPGAEGFDSNPKAIVMMNSGQGGDLLPRCPGAVDLLYCCPTCGLGWILAPLLGIDNGYGDNPWTPPDVCAYGEYKPVDDGQHCMVTDATYLSGNPSDITYNPLWIVMSGDEDIYVGETAPLNGYCLATNITDKQYLRVLSDYHGNPSKNDLIANHTNPIEANVLFPVWTGKVDAHDHWAYWKIVTAAMNCAIHDQDCSYARGGTDDQLNMGMWSDGEPVKRMQWNPRVRDNDGICYPLEDACEMVNDIDPVSQQSAWNWRGPGIPADCDNLP